MKRASPPARRFGRVLSWLADVEKVRQKRVMRVPTPKRRARPDDMAGKPFEGS